MFFKRFFSFNFDFFRFRTSIYVFFHLRYFYFRTFLSVFFVFDMIFVFVRLFVFQMKKDVRPILNILILFKPQSYLER